MNDEDDIEDETIESILANAGLRDRVQKFVREYFYDLNATQAAIRAGYSENGAHVQGSRLLRNDKVALCVHKIKSAKANLLQFGKDDVIAVNIEIVRDPTSTKAEIQKSADALARIYGMFNDKLALAGNVRMQHEEWLDELDDIEGTKGNSDEDDTEDDTGHDEE